MWRVFKESVGELNFESRSCAAAEEKRFESKSFRFGSIEVECDDVIFPESGSMSGADTDADVTPWPQEMLVGTPEMRVAIGPPGGLRGYVALTGQ